ncbi:DUF2190 family protein [Corynebacterium ulceribovis]|uniref:DUF2190 family protein n=1 Tax=Corynebacterium ulceribovis TaxID=487732 RepID=UPI00036D2AA4|nr:DUF2190 family protein [Corynebacterium ulceribovis]
MSNPTFTQGPISFEIAKDLDKFRLVKLDEDGKLTYAAETGEVLGVITENGRLNPLDGGAKTVAVHYGTAAVKLETSGDIKAGAKVCAAADGKVSATGDVTVGVAICPTEDGKTLTIINGLPVAATA